MRMCIMAAAGAGAVIFSLVGNPAFAQTVDVIQPARGAIVRETVPIRLAPGDAPAGGYFSLTIDGKFITAQVLPLNLHAPIYLWNTKASGDARVPDGLHTITLEVYNGSSDPVGTDTFTVHVENQIKAPSKDLKLIYHWTTQPDLVYHRESKMSNPGAAAGSINGMPASDTPTADQVLESSQVTFQRKAEDATAEKALLRDMILAGTVTDHGQTQTIRTSYNLAPLLREVNAAGAVLNTQGSSDFKDHIGFSVPEMPVRRVGVGDSWEVPVQIPLTWNSSNSAHVMADCRLIDFEWQNNYPTAKIQETYSGSAHFVPHGVSVSGHAPPPAMDVSAVTYRRVLYFAYGAGRLIKSDTHTEITMTDAQMNLLGGNANGIPGGPGGYPEGGPPMGMPPGGMGGGPPMGYPGPGGPPMGYPGPGGPPQGGDYGGQAQQAPVDTSAHLDTTETTTLQVP